MNSETLSEDPRTISAVLHSIAGNVEGLVKAEIGLAKVEARQVLHKTERAAVRMLIGVALGELALGFILLAVVQLLATRVEPWVAALIVGVVVAIGAGIFVATGLGKMKEVKIPGHNTGRSLAHEGGLHHG